VRNHRRCLLLIWLAAGVVLGARIVAAQTPEPFSLDTSPLPAPTGYINDFAGVVDAGTKARLEKSLDEFKKRTGVEMAVAVVGTTGDRPIFDYSLAVARGWRIGSKETDNPGLLVLVAIEDRKYFTQISKDLEDELPDALAGSLQRQYLVPEFRKANYSKGIADLMAAYMSTIDARRSGTNAPSAGSEGPAGEDDGTQGLFTAFCCLIIIVVILIVIFSNRSGGGRGGRTGGGGFGGALPWIVGSILTSGSSSSGSGWGGSSGSDWGGSSGGWGGFGGGGDFGGGGAGGGW
jgi:uncharacterized protein